MNTTTPIVIQAKNKRTPNLKQHPTTGTSCHNLKICPHGLHHDCINRQRTRMCESEAVRVDRPEVWQEQLATVYAQQC